MGISFADKLRGGSLAAALIVKLLPVIRALPFWTAEVGVLLASVWAEDALLKTGLTPTAQPKTKTSAPTTPKTKLPLTPKMAT